MSFCENLKLETPLEVRGRDCGEFFRMRCRHMPTLDASSSSNISYFEIVGNFLLNLRKRTHTITVKIVFYYAHFHDYDDKNRKYTLILR